ncbi:ISAon1 family transposase [Tenacibaculum sp.]|uniref:ISAon1 family transposase n=1 Tax=Tenacibaculum sp. TaxID=1906242 RepID=UPI003D10DACC
MVSTKTNDCHTIGGFYGVNGKKLQRHFRDYLSDFKEWKQKSHAKRWLLYPENMGPYLFIDETALSKGEFYTIIINKKAKGKKGALVGIFQGTKAELIIEQLLKLPSSVRSKVKEITLDMVYSMKHIVKACFPKAIQVTDRFHVQKLAIEALQELRIKYHWEALDRENEAIKQCKATNKQYTPTLFSNGDSTKQLLARSRYLLYKSPEKWTPSQKERGQLLFKEYPQLKKAYGLVPNIKKHL